MQFKPSKQLYRIEVEFDNGLTKGVKVRATSKEIAERIALKRNPSAKRVKRDAA